MHTPNPLPLSFYQHHDVVYLAKTLLGKVLLTHIDGHLTGGPIIETEAYWGVEDRACHAYGGRRTKRTEVMFRKGGIAYVFLIYGLHSCFNIVTHCEGHPHAVLIRAIKPTIGIETMLQRRNKIKLDKTLTSGPGSTAQALKITTALTGIPLDRPPIWLEDRGIQVKKFEATPRIGVDYAGEDARLPWRFVAEIA